MTGHSGLDYGRHGYDWEVTGDPAFQSPIVIPESYFRLERRLIGNDTSKASLRHSREISHGSTAPSNRNDALYWVEDLGQTTPRTTDTSPARSLLNAVSAPQITSASFKPYTGTMDLQVNKTIDEISVAGSLLQQNRLIVDGATYYLAGFHFHAPAEHLVMKSGYGPIRHDGEVHFVFVDKDSVPSAVIGFVLKTEAGAVNEGLSPFLTKECQSSQTLQVAFANGIIAATAGTEEPVFAAYPGSLTTPPCSTIIRWFVGEATIGATEQTCLSILRANGANGNWRAPQELYCRSITQIQLEKA